MAQKKITDLQLIAAVLTGLNVPGDDGIQSYRFTVDQLKEFILATGNVTLAMLNTSIFNGLSAVSAADDDYFILNDTSDANKTKKALVSTFVRNLYRNVTSYPATIASTDGTLKLSGSAGTITLPANNASAPGKRYTMVHAGSNFVAYTIATTGGATVGGISSGSYSLYTFGEAITVEDNGTNWEIVNRVSTYPAETYLPVTQGLGTLAGTSKVYWSRVADHLHIQGVAVSGTVTSAQLQINFPVGCQAAKTGIGTLWMAGTGYIGFSSSGGWPNSPALYANEGTTYLNIQQQSTTSIAAGTGSGVSGTGVANRLNARIPIEGWRP